MLLLGWSGLYIVVTHGEGCYLMHVGGCMCDKSVVNGWSAQEDVFPDGQLVAIRGSKHLLVTMLCHVSSTLPHNHKHGPAQHQLCVQDQQAKSGPANVPRLLCHGACQQYWPSTRES